MIKRCYARMGGADFLLLTPPRFHPIFSSNVLTSWIIIAFAAMSDVAVAADVQRLLEKSMAKSTSQQERLDPCR